MDLELNMVCWLERVSSGDAAGESEGPNNPLQVRTHRARRLPDRGEMKVPEEPECDSQLFQGAVERRARAWVAICHHDL